MTNTGTGKGILGLIVVGMLLLLDNPFPTTSREFVNYTEIKIHSKNGENGGQLVSQETGTRSQPKTIDDQSDKSSPSYNSCWRKCDHYNNKIILYPSVLHKAGLADRAIVFANLLNIAGYLCATAFVPAPANSLAQWHARRDDPSLVNTSWSDFLDLRMLSSNRSDILVTLPYDFDDNDPVEALLSPEDTSDNDWRYVTTTDMTQIGHDFEQVEEVSWKRNSYFVWGIQTRKRRNFFAWSRFFHNYLQTRMLLRNNNNTQSAGNATDVTMQVASPIDRSTMLPQAIHSSNGCAYSAVYPPSHVQAMADLVWERVQNRLDDVFANYSILGNNGVYRNISHGDVLVGYLHIRRGDVRQKICKTPLERMEAFLRCSFQHIERNRTALLFSSDEKDPLYRRAIQSYVERYVGQFFDLDQMARDTVQQDIAQAIGGAPAPAAYRKNNYYIYHVVATVAQQRTTFQLLQRRHFSCLDCVNMSLDDLPQEEIRLEYYLTPLPPR